MMNIGLHHRNVDPQLRAVLQSELDRRPNHQVVDCFQRLWRQTDEAALEGIVFRDRRAVEVSELTQRQSIRNAFAQLAIVPVLEPHQNQRAQDLRRRQSATTAAGLLLTSSAAVTVAFGHEDHGNFSAGEPGDSKKPTRIVQVTMREEPGKMMFIPNRVEVKKKGNKSALCFETAGRLSTNSCWPARRTTPSTPSK